MNESVRNLGLPLGSFIQFLCGWKWNPVRCHCSIALLQGKALPPRSIPCAPDVFSDTPAAGPLLLAAAAAAAAVVVSPTPTVMGRGGAMRTPASATTASSSRQASEGPAVGAGR